MQESAITLNTTLKPDGEGHLSRLQPAPDVLQTILELVNHAPLCASFSQVAQEEARRIHAFKMDKSLNKAAEDALFYALQIGYREAKEELKNALFCFMKKVLTEMAHRSTLRDLFK